MTPLASPSPLPSPVPPVLTVVGIGADGWDGLALASRDALRSAGVLLGGARQLDLLPRSAPVNGSPGRRRCAPPSRA